MDIACGLKDKLSTHILKSIPERELALLLSGGVDSISLFLLLRELGYKVNCYTFHVRGVNSTDLERAASVCNTFPDSPHYLIRLNNDLDALIKDLFELCRVYPQAETKTDFECFWTLKNAFDKIPEKHIVTGLGSDGNFGTSKKALIHFKDDFEKFREYRLKNAKSPKYAQKGLCDRYGELNNKVIVSPYRSAPVSNYLAQFDWYQLNKPRQKAPIVGMFEEAFKLLGAPKNQAFQCGDSGIQDMFHRLTSHQINVRGLRTSAGIFNQIKDIVKDENLPGALPYRSQASLF